MTHQMDEIIIEITVQGHALRVSALDVASLVEIVFQAPLSADRITVERLARQKLAWRLARDGNPPGRPDGRGGTLA